MDQILHPLSLYLARAEARVGLVSDIFLPIMSDSRSLKVGFGNRLYAASYAMKFITHAIMPICVITSKYYRLISSLEWNLLIAWNGLNTVRIICTVSCLLSGINF
jgi:hypothetical protein